MFLNFPFPCFGSHPGEKNINKFSNIELSNKNHLLPLTHGNKGFPGGSAVKKPPANAGDAETWVQFLDQEDPLKEETATHSSILAWKIPWTEKPGRLQPMGSQRVGHD